MGKGRNWKQILASEELEWNVKEQEIQKRHSKELDAIFTPDISNNEILDHQPMKNFHNQTCIPNTPPAKLKAIYRKERQRENRKKKELSLSDEILNIGPSPRDLELQKINKKHLQKLNMTIYEIQADGNCLYRAIAHQLQMMGENSSFENIRMLCAQELTENKVQYEPFVNLDDVNASSYEHYVDIVRDGNEGAWGGHLELRALACRLRRRIHVYDAENDIPLVIIDDRNDIEKFNDEEVVRLSFHRFYFVLGEHYNSVIPLNSITP